MTTAAQTDLDLDSIRYLPLSQVITDPHQPRKNFEKDTLQALADDIKARGVLQPITVRPTENGKMMIVYGERRYKASRLAKIKSIPTITVTGERDPVDRLIDQVAENMQRDDLKPMELAAFFESLYTDHNIKLKDIPEILEQRGLKKMERSYITNMRRLLKLPDWAKEMVDTGVLTASHGKHILAAEGHDEVLDGIRTDIESDIQYQEKPPSVNELANCVEMCFGQAYRDITNAWQDWRKDGTKFDIKSCAECKNCKTFKGQYNNDRIYCFDEACWQQKQDAAFEAEKQKQEKAAAKASREAAARGEDTPLSKAQIANRDGRIERTKVYLDEWLRGQLRTYLVDDAPTQYQILLWVAAGAPNNRSGYNMNGGIKMPDSVGWSTDLHEYGIDIMLKNKIGTEEMRAEIIECTLVSLDRENLGRLAHHCDITLDEYNIEREYLEIKTKDELITGTPEKVCDAFDDWPKETKKSRGELIDGILNRDHAYGVPADLIKFFGETA